MTDIKRSSIFASIVALLTAAFFMITSYSAQPSFSAAPDGVAATVATTSNPTVGTTAKLLFATSTCAARVITTRAQPIMLTFSDRIGQVPTGTFGHLQGASTTVTYDASLFGCNAIKVRAFGTDTVTVSETR